MAGKYGVSEIKKVFKSAGNIGEGVEQIWQALKSGDLFSKLKIGSIIMNMISDVISLVGMNVVEFKAEAGELDAAEKKDVVDSFKADFDLKADNVEKAIEEMISVVVDASNIIDKAIKFVNENFPAGADIIKRLLAIFKKPQ